jgi:hypothetical protein
MTMVFTSLNRTNHQMKEMGTVTTPVPSPIPPTKGLKLECELDLGVIEEDEESDMNAELVCNPSGTPESPVTSIRSFPVCTHPP